MKRSMLLGLFAALGACAMVVVACGPKAAVLAPPLGAGTGVATGAGGASVNGSSASGGGSGGAGGTVPFVEATHPPFPILGANDHAVNHVPRLVVLVSEGDPDADKFFAFGDALLASQWLQVVGKDYGVSPKAGVPSVHVTTPAVSGTMDNGALDTYVKAAVAANPAIALDGETVYLFLYPPGSDYGDGCSYYGAHNTLADEAYGGAPTDSLAWVQRCPPSPGEDAFDALTLTASHEFMESVTDSYPPHGYAMPDKHWALYKNAPPWAISSWSYAQTDTVEVGDLCEGTVIHEAGFAYQRIWSTSAAALGGDPCVPALAEPYYSVSAPADWIAEPAGTTVTIPVTGWSTGPRPDWYVSAFYADTRTGGFAPTFSGSTSIAVNNGKTVPLTLTMPPASGTFGVFWLSSSETQPDSGANVPATGDPSHFWLFGVYTTELCAGCTAPASCGDDTCEPAKGETCANCTEDCGACASVCGPANLSVPSGAGVCPTYASCMPDGSCACDTGYTQSTCLGDPCTGASCGDVGSWWCVPSSCGKANFAVPCGNGHCPLSSDCTATTTCECVPGSVSATCDGQLCPSSGCPVSNWWCTVCGQTNNIVQCSGYVCPSLSTCGANGDCECVAGYHGATCDGSSCSGGCTGANWWCIPD